MKVIDVLNKIANGEEVRFKINGSIYHCYKYSNLYNEDLKEDVEWYLDEEWLNEEVEIIEEDKKIEKIWKLDYEEDVDEISKLNIVSKINEIIDYINKEE